MAGAKNLIFWAELQGGLVSEAGHLSRILEATHFVESMSKHSPASPTARSLDRANLPSLCAAPVTTRLVYRSAFMCGPWVKWAMELVGNCSFETSDVFVSDEQPQT